MILCKLINALKNIKFKFDKIKNVKTYLIKIYKHIEKHLCKNYKEETI